MDLRLSARRTLAAALAAFAAVLLTASPAAAQTDPEAPPGPGSTLPDPVPPGYFPPTPAGYSVSSREAVRIADVDRNVVEQTLRHGRLTTAIQTKENKSWQVGYKTGDREVAQVIVDGVTGAIRESWTGHQVAWPMARGYEGQFGHKLNAVWVWLPLSTIFFLALLDWRRPWRIVHLDLLVLLSFAVSHIFFNRGEIGISVPLVYPVLLYLFARMLWIGFRGGVPLRPSMPAFWLAILAVFLIVFRVTLNVADSGVIDVGYAGTIGADRITHGEPVWGEESFPEDNRFGDTYGPLNYYAYVPFELALPWSGGWDELAASHAAAIGFDLATVLGLFAFGARSRAGAQGRELGSVLAFGWLAFPYTTFALQSNSNDTLVAALLVWSLVAFARPLARGALLAAATWAKFAPLVLAPLFAAGERGLLARNTNVPPASSASPPGAAGSASERTGTARPVATFVAAFAAATVVLLAVPAIDPGLATFWERTVSSQLDRTSPFSIWGQVDGVEWVQKLVLVVCAGLALALAFVPRRRSIAQVAALAAAVLIALQLAVDHWFYLYIPWFLGPILIALATMTARVGGVDARESRA